MRRRMLRKYYYFLILLVFLFSITPDMAASQTKESPGGAAGTEELLGKWSGTWSRPDPKRAGQDVIMEIKKVDREKNILQINYSWSGVRGGSPGEAKAKATLIPPDKFEWHTGQGTHYQFYLKGGELWENRIVGRDRENQKIVLKKLKE